MKDSLLLFRANQSKLEQQQKISTARGAAPAPPQALTRRTLSPLAAQQPSTPNPHSTWRRRLPGRRAPPPTPIPAPGHRGPLGFAPSWLLLTRSASAAAGGGSAVRRSATIRHVPRDGGGGRQTPRGRCGRLSVPAAPFQPPSGSHQLEHLPHHGFAFYRLGSKKPAFTKKRRRAQPGPAGGRVMPAGVYCFFSAPAPLFLATRCLLYVWIHG